MALVLRQINCLRSKFLIYRSIMTSESRVQKVMEDLQQNPYFDKYANKIATLQKNAPEEFMERIEVKHKELEQLKEEKISTKRYESVLKPKEPLKEKVAPVNKKLEDIFKVELAKDKNAEEIRDIWVKYHIQKDVIAATIPVDIYKKMIERVRKYPTFLFPLPRSQGYEFIMSQATGNEVHLTTLLCYQVHKENAPECLTIIHYEELAEEKGIVLMRGEYDKNVLDAKEAQCLANQFQMYYGQNQKAKMELLDTFTTKPENFSHNNLISELEKLTIA